MTPSNDETPGSETTFADLGLPQALLDTVEDLGFTTPTPIQAAVIPPLLAGHDLIGRARTGSGKTAAFGLPMLARVAASLAARPIDGTVRALVLAPTRELALQVTDAVRQLGHGSGLPMLTVYGGTSYGPQLRGLSRGVPIVVGTPGRLIDLLERGSLRLDAVEYVVLDEADEMLAMGFIEDVERLLAGTPEERQVALLSATMPSAIRRIATTTLREPVMVQIDGGRSATGHITQRWMAVQQRYKAEALVRLLRAEPKEATLAFCRTRAGCDEVAETLRHAGLNALALHGDLTQVAREQVVSQLRDERVRVVVATDVAARGLDVEQLGHVINVDLPNNSEVYTHRIGRTGRAGRAGKATTLVASSEWRKFLGMVRHLRPDVDEIRPPSDGAIVDAQRDALVEGVLAPIGEVEGENYSGAPLDLARQWVVDVIEEHELDAAEIASLALLRLANDRGVPMLADADRSLPRWATNSAAPRHIRNGHLHRSDGRDSRDDGPRQHRLPREEQQRTERPQRPNQSQRPEPPPRYGQQPRHERGPRPQSNVRMRDNDADHVDLFIPVGENRNVTASDLVGAIAHAADVPGRAIGKIRIHDKVSFVALPEALAVQVLERVETLQIRGMRIAVLRARPAGGRPGSGDGPRGGRGGKRRR